MSASGLDQDRLRRLLEVGSAVVSELDLEAVLRRVLEVAREVTGARYAAVGVLDAEGTELERFITSGVDDDTRRQIGDLPRGRGILGELIRKPEPLRLDVISDHPHSYGLPPGHPPMTSFLGVPVVVRGKAWGNLYLTDKEGAPFDEDDERSLIILSDWAAIAIANARLYGQVTQHSEELERAVTALEATTAVARAVGAETDLDKVLELVVKRGRALLDARAVAILLAADGELVLAATAGDFDREAGALRLPVEGTAPGSVLQSGSAQFLTSAEAAASPLGRLVTGFEAAMIVPLAYRARSSGVLIAFDRADGGPRFDSEDQRLAEAFAASAATAVATAQTVQADRLRRTIEAAEQERRRWARELHDETLQGLGGLQLLLESALHRGGDVQEAALKAVAQINGEIENLQGLIAELRPAALDELGLEAAIGSLAARTASVQGLAVDVDLSLPEGRFAPELESTVFRLCQEALTNVGKHADAENVEVCVAGSSKGIEVRVSDDGRGFEPGRADGGYGLIGMAERVQLIGGSLDISSSPGNGTTIRAVLPRGG